jgi:hypothetical protein
LTFGRVTSNKYFIFQVRVLHQTKWYILFQSRILELLQNKKPQLLHGRLRKIWLHGIYSITAKVAKDGGWLMWDKVNTQEQRQKSIIMPPHDKDSKMEFHS